MARVGFWILDSVPVTATLNASTFDDAKFRHVEGRVSFVRLISIRIK